MKLWDVATGDERATLKGQTGELVFVAFTADGRTLATASAGVYDWKAKRSVPGEVKLWDVDTGREKATFSESLNLLWAVTADGKTLASANRYVTGQVKLWDAVTWTQKAALKELPFPLTALALTADGKTLASVSHEEVGHKTLGVVKLWDVDTGKEKATFKGIEGANNPLAFTADAKTLASASQELVRRGSSARRTVDEFAGVVKVWVLAPVDGAAK